MFQRIISTNLALPGSFRDARKNLVAPLGKPHLHITNFRGANDRCLHGCIVVELWVPALVRGYRRKTVDRTTHTLAKFVIVGDWRAAIAEAREFLNCAPPYSK